MTQPVPAERSGVRRRLADARATIVGTKGLRAKVAKQGAALSALRTRVDDHKQRLARQDQRLKTLEEKVRELRRASALDTVERERRDTQVGMVEQRLAELERRLADVRSGLASAPVDADQLAEGSRLLEEVRTEHARVRARMQVVSAYEERLRRVEESVAQLFDGDPRHLV